MDHFFQIRGVGRPEEPMLEGWTTLGLHGRPHDAGPPRPDGRRRPLPPPGLWVKAATTLDVLSGGRAWLGIGAAWNEEESRAPGLPVPAARPSASRCSRRRSGSSTRCGPGERGTEAAFEGRQYQADAAAQLPAVDLATARADHDRRRRREEDAPPGRPVRRRDATSSAAAETIAPQVRGPPRALRRGRARPGRDRADRRSSP